MAVKRKVEYEDLATNGGMSVRLLESGDWNLTVPDKLGKKDLLTLRALLNYLIEEQEILK